MLDLTGTHWFIASIQHIRFSESWWNFLICWNILECLLIMKQVQSNNSWRESSIFLVNSGCLCVCVIFVSLFICLFVNFVNSVFLLFVYFKHLAWKNEWVMLIIVIFGFASFCLFGFVFNGLCVLFRSTMNQHFELIDGKLVK